MRPLLLLLTLVGGRPALAQTDSPPPVETPVETPLETPVETPLETPVEAPASPEAPARVLPPLEVQAQAGVLVQGYSHGGGRWEDALLAKATSGHALLGGLTLEASLLSLLPLEAGGPGASLTLGLRVGYTGERFSLTAGPVVNVAYQARPRVQVLPSLLGRLRAGPLVLDAGLFDAHGLVPAHVGAQWGPVGLGYVLPLGARAWGRLPLTARAGLRVEAFAFRMGTSHAALLTVGVVGNPSSPGVQP